MREVAFTMMEQSEKRWRPWSWKINSIKPEIDSDWCIMKNYWVYQSTWRADPNFGSCSILDLNFGSCSLIWVEMPSTIDGKLHISWYGVQIGNWLLFEAWVQISNIPHISWVKNHTNCWELRWLIHFSIVAVPAYFVFKWKSKTIVNSACIVVLVK